MFILLGTTHTIAQCEIRCKGARDNLLMHTVRASNDMPAPYK